MPTPIIIPHDSNAGSWRAHAMHCETCRPIYENERALNKIILMPLLVLLVVSFVWLTFNACRLIASDGLRRPR